MADPTGIAGVIGAAGQFLVYTFKFCKSWKDAEAEAKRFILEVGVLRTALLHARSTLSGANAFKDDSSALLSELDPL